MIFKVVAKTEFEKFIEKLIGENETFGPKEVDKNTKGEPIYKFVQIHGFDEMDLNYTLGYSSIKNFFLPYREELSRFKFSDGDWEQEIEYRVHPRVIVGARACDISALNILDKVFLEGTFPSPYYIARRKNTFLIGMDHLPPEDCFCASLNRHAPRQGFNLYCSDIGDKYYLSILSSKAFNYLKSVKTTDPSKSDDRKYIERSKRIKKSFKTHVEVAGLPTYLDIEFQSPIWKKWGDKCLNCGACAMVCPTCYCHGVKECITPDLTTAHKERFLYSCNVVDFAEVAGGDNFRPRREDRLKYRFYHQYRGFAENGDQQICVGCNRCGRACLAGINPKDVINDLRLEDGT